MNTSIQKLGEFGLIKRIRKSLKAYPSVVKGSGDDCAVVDFDKRHYMLLTCDMLVQGVDFKADTDPRLVGRKAIAVSLSDIAACGGWPRYCTVSLGLPKNYPLAGVDALTRGMAGMADAYELAIVGGDMSRAPALTIDVNMVGLVEKKKLVLRSGAQENDVIFVTGKLGGSIGGRHLTFTPRLKEARELLHNGKLHAMIDISDGLVQDLGHILEESRKGAVLYQDLIPLHKDALGLKDALYSGEDFELLCTASSKEAHKIMQRHRPRIYPIGEIIPREAGLVMFDGTRKVKKIPLAGYRHF